MTVGRPTRSIEHSEELKKRLEQIANSRSLPYGLLRRDEIVIIAARGINNQTILQNAGLSGRMVGIWRQRFLNQGIVGLYDEAGPGAPRTIGDDHIANLIEKTLKTKPADDTHWTCWSIGKETGLRKSTCPTDLESLRSSASSGLTKSVRSKLWTATNRYRHRTWLSISVTHQHRLRKNLGIV